MLISDMQSLPRTTIACTNAPRMHGSPEEMTDHRFSPGPRPDTVRSADGSVLTVPESWVLLPPGDAALTRRVKGAGDHWIVQEKKGRRMFSRGVWAAAATIDRIRANFRVRSSSGSR